MDGKTADRPGASRWITGAGARLEAHRLRSRADAVVVGIGTVLTDDPGLDVRLGGPGHASRFRVVVDSRARLPVTARLIRGSEGRGIPSGRSSRSRTPPTRSAWPLSRHAESRCSGASRRTGKSTSATSCRETRRARRSRHPRGRGRQARRRLPRSGPRGSRRRLYGARAPRGRDCAGSPRWPGPAPAGGGPAEGHRRSAPWDATG